MLMGMSEDGWWVYRICIREEILRYRELSGLGRGRRMIIGNNLWNEVREVAFGFAIRLWPVRTGVRTWGSVRNKMKIIIPSTRHMGTDKALDHTSRRDTESHSRRLRLIDPKSLKSCAHVRSTTLLEGNTVPNTSLP